MPEALIRPRRQGNYHAKTLNPHRSVRPVLYPQHTRRRSRDLGQRLIGPGPFGQCPCGPRERAGCLGSGPRRERATPGCLVGPSGGSLVGTSSRQAAGQGPREEVVPPDPFSRRFVESQRRAELRARAVAYKGGRCSICKYDFCPAAMDFHHPDPLEKDFDISARMTSWKAIVKELDKCELLCCRCHREVHDGLHPRFLADPDADRGQIDDGDCLPEESHQADLEE